MAESVDIDCWSLLVSFALQSFVGNMSSKSRWRSTSAGHWATIDCMPFSVWNWINENKNKTVIRHRLPLVCKCAFHTSIALVIASFWQCNEFDVIADDWFSLSLEETFSCQRHKEIDQFRRRATDGNRMVILEDCRAFEWNRNLNTNLVRSHQ